MQRRDAVRTPVSASDLCDALGAAWRELFDSDAPREALVLLVGQWALETGWGKSCFCWNLGNAKARVGGVTDWQFYACDEVLVGAMADRLVAEDPAHVRIEWTRELVGADGKTTRTCGVAFTPDHPACCFEAFATLADGARAWLSLQHGTFAHAWPALLTGVPAQFSHALREARYYTAPEDRYTATLVATVAEVQSRLGYPAITEDVHQHEDVITKT